MRLAIWTAGALALGWLATAASFAFPGGHPRLWYFVGGFVVLALNLGFLGVAVGLWFLFQWAAARR
jgi:hypothetical protein